MTLLSAILGTLIAIILGCAFHFWRGGGFKWLVIYNLFAIIGFWIGHFLGSIIKVSFLLLGPIYLGTALIGAVVVLFGGYWLSMASVETVKK